MCIGPVHSMVQYRTVHFGTVHYGTVQYSMVQYREKTFILLWVEWGDKMSILELGSVHLELGASYNIKTFL